MGGDLAPLDDGRPVRLAVFGVVDTTIAEIGVKCRTGSHAHTCRGHVALSINPCPRQAWACAEFCRTNYDPMAILTPTRPMLRPQSNAAGRVAAPHSPVRLAGRVGRRRGLAGRRHSGSTLAADWFFEPSAAVRGVMLALVALGLAAVVVRLIGRRAFVRITDGNAAMVLERRFPATER